MRERTRSSAREAAPASAQGVDHFAIGGERETLELDGGTSDIPTQPLEPIPIVGCDADFGVQRETVDVTAQLAWQRARALVAASATEALDGGAAVRSERHATLHGGGAELCEQRFLGLGRRGLVVLVPRDAATAAQVLHDAAAKAHGYLGDVLVGERRGCQTSCPALG